MVLTDEVLTGPEFVNRGRWDFFVRLKHDTKSIKTTKQCRDERNPAVIMQSSSTAGS